MEIAEKVMKVVFAGAMLTMTLYLGNELIYPLLTDVLAADLNFFAFSLTLSAVLLFIIAVWGFFAYGTAILASAIGLVLGLFAEMIAWCYRKICP